MDYTISLKVNGIPYEVRVSTEVSLLNLLRDELDLTGTKDGCHEGECGACTVIMNGKPVNACLVLAVEANGSEILTVEGLSQGEELHPLQQAFVDCGAIQCGFCTPGMLMSAKALLDENSCPTPEEVRKALRGNLCRCTGYKKIEEAVQQAARVLRGEKGWLNHPFQV
jgi:aerobic carbon-monoxide dehydrogenase small subunit